MILPINHEYRLASDQYSWSIERKCTGKERWIKIRWYGSLQQTINGLSDLMLKTSNAETLADALNVTQNISHTLQHALADIYILKRKTNGDRNA